MKPDLVKDIILNYYKHKTSPKEPFINEDYCTVTAETTSLGNTIALTNIPRDTARAGRRVRLISDSPFFVPLMKFNSYYVPEPDYEQPLLNIDILHDYDLKGGHLLQKIQRALGFEVDVRPSGTIQVEQKVTKNLIALHLTAGASLIEQRRYHRRPKLLYSEHRAILQQFILDHPEYRFVELGHRSVGLQGVENCCGVELEQTISILKDCEYFIGTDSGVMNLAAALGIKSIIVINLPPIEQVYLPLLVDMPAVSIDWLYPQNVHLHQDGEHELVKRFSYENLQRALNGELYPFWSDEYLDLIEYQVPGNKGV
jgi:hypothetical protein